MVFSTTGSTISMSCELWCVPVWSCGSVSFSLVCRGSAATVVVVLVASLPSGMSSTFALVDVLVDASYASLAMFRVTVVM